MQTYGLGTALKILLGYDHKYKRNELVALFNMVNKISISINTFFNYADYTGEGIGGELNKKYHDVEKIVSSGMPNEVKSLVGWGAIGGVLVILEVIFGRSKQQKDTKKKNL
jgi:hypothetical protein